MRRLFLWLVDRISIINIHIHNAIQPLPLPRQSQRRQRFKRPHSDALVAHTNQIKQPLCTQSLCIEQNVHTRIVEHRRQP